MLSREACQALAGIAISHYENPLETLEEIGITADYADDSTVNAVFVDENRITEKAVVTAFNAVATKRIPRKYIVTEYYGHANLKKKSDKAVISDRTGELFAALYDCFHDDSILLKLWQKLMNETGDKAKIDSVAATTLVSLHKDFWYYSRNRVSFQPDKKPRRDAESTSVVLDSSFDNIINNARIDYMQAESKPLNDDFLKIPENLAGDCVFSGMRICFTGFTKKEKENINWICEELQIKRTSDVYSDINFLIIGSTPGPVKMEYCRKHDIPIIGIFEFLEQIKAED